MKRTIAVLVATVAGSIAMLAAPASAGEFCYDVNVNVAGTSVLAQQGCQPIG